MSIEAIKEALKAYPAGWETMTQSWPLDDSDFGEYEVGAIDEDGKKWPIISVCTAVYFRPEATPPIAAFIAACNPVAIRSLIERLEAAEMDARRWQLRYQTLRALYPSAPSEAELDAAIDFAVEAGK